MPLTHITTCLLCDPAKPKQFAATAIPEVKPGEQPPPEVVRFLTAVATHVAKAHPDAYTLMQQLGSLLQSFVLMKNFQTTDPGLMEASNVARHFVHKLTQKEPITYRMIEERFVSVTNDSPSGDMVSLCDFIDLKDWLLEEGEYAPKTTKPSEIVTA